MSNATYQKEVYEQFKPYRPSADFPIYPPYHRGPYLEEYFCQEFEKQAPLCDRIFIPVHWTNCYKLANDRPVRAFSQALKSLDPNYEYFIVSTHDDAPREEVPAGTICYSAGGNAGTVPIPLICSTIPDPSPDREKHFFASFAGSYTHPVRMKMWEAVEKNPKYNIGMKEWKESVTLTDKNHFKYLMEHSEFALCPRGYGRTSYRLYEAMQLGAIPVYVSDEFWIPWEEEINWYEFCVFIPEHRICEMDFILSAISSEQKVEMRRKMKEAYDKHFTMEAVTQKIIAEMSNSPE